MIAAPLFAAALAAASVGTTSTGPIGLAATFQNTIVSTYADGETARLWVDATGQYRGVGRRGDASSGRWKVKHDKLCFRQSRPFPAPFDYCTPIVQGGVGSEWKIKSVFGEPLDVQLVAGR